MLKFAIKKKEKIYVMKNLYSLASVLTVRVLLQVIIALRLPVGN